MTTLTDKARRSPPPDDKAQKRIRQAAQALLAGINSPTTSKAAAAAEQLAASPPTSSRTHASTMGEALSLLSDTLSSHWVQSTPPVLTYDSSTGGLSFDSQPWTCARLMTSGLGASNVALVVTDDGYPRYVNVFRNPKKGGWGEQGRCVSGELAKPRRRARRRVHRGSHAAGAEGRRGPARRP